MKAQPHLRVRLQFLEVAFFKLQKNVLPDAAVVLDDDNFQRPDPFFRTWRRTYRDSAPAVRHLVIRDVDWSHEGIVRRAVNAQADFRRLYSSRWWAAFAARHGSQRQPAEYFDRVPC
jgi:hypothetical protein